MEKFGNTSANVFIAVEMNADLFPTQMPSLQGLDTRFRTALTACHAATAIKGGSFAYGNSVRVLSLATGHNAFSYAGFLSR